MKSVYFAKCFFFLCSILVMINLVEISKTHLFSLDALIQFGLLMLTLELAIHIKPTPIIIQEHQPKQFEIKPKKYAYYFSKIGVTSLIFGYMVQAFSM